MEKLFVMAGKTVMLLLCFSGPDVPSITACYFGYVWTMMKLPKQAPWTASGQPGFSLYECNFLSPDINAWEPLLYLDLRATLHRLLTGYSHFGLSGSCCAGCSVKMSSGRPSSASSNYFGSHSRKMVSLVFLCLLPLFGYYIDFVVLGGIVGV
ncbi:hypothetical protein KFK09_028067 [Dendrobium nobile]|uniref:Uncharacterized protein n=1 Tax=Dendrobium nobile TaxID=94219 RepID=A0A8T3A2K0_DENNO|nr:hypothetical protein KFK09_028067 [Dendrobium nobile]